MKTINKRVTINITGRVQGVNFRVYANLEAEKLGVSGFVKNEDDGSVTIVAEGETESVNKLIEWAKHGSNLSYVKRMKLKFEKPTGEFQGFEIRYQ